ncbi:MAG: alpha/beta hydrolase [Bacteroidetes bacterium]|nr:MAG: alpha/beta hydrolase [Bacteroidota bacterium]
MYNKIKEENGFQYVEEGEGEVLLLLHGLFGGMSNWEGILEFTKQGYRVIIPLLPIYEIDQKLAHLEGLVEFIESFLTFKSLDRFSVFGNSLGGHLALLYTLKYQYKIKTLILTGSSGLFEDSMGGSYPKRGNFEFIKQRVGYTFYDANFATDELVNEVFETTKSIPKCMRIVAIAKSAQRNNLSKQIVDIHVPTLLVWGLNDTITPPLVAHEFDRLLPNSELQFIDKCGHAPMMEHPTIFNHYVKTFLQKHS